jgi:hypothetical protein
MLHSPVVQETNYSASRLKDTAEFGKRLLANRGFKGLPKGRGQQEEQQEEQHEEQQEEEVQVNI